VRSGGVVVVQGGRVLLRGADDVFPQREGSAIVGSCHSIAVGQGSSSVDPVLCLSVRATRQKGS